jgi:prepilin-type N-terminal cleavage/methylation domain-containing protein
MKKTRSLQKGLTLIEVLVSLSIFLVVLLAIYQLFDTSHATYAAGTRKQDVQQQARLAMDQMVRALRMAGYVPENYDTVAGNELSSTARIHIATDNFLAVLGDLNGSGQTALFVFCRNGNTLVTKWATDTTVAPTYTCGGDVMADSLTPLKVGTNPPSHNGFHLTYFDGNGAQVVGTQISAATGSAPAIMALDNKAPAAVPNLTPRVQRDSVRTIVISLQITEPVVRQDPQVYNLTSTVRLRNLNNL